MLKNVAASLQRERDVAQKERDAAKSDAQKAEQEHTTLSAKVADLTRQLNNASSQIKGMSKSDGSPKQDISAKGKGNTRNETANPQQDGGKPVPKQGGAQSGSMTDAQVGKSHHVSSCMAHCPRLTSLPSVTPPMSHV